MKERTFTFTGGAASFLGVGIVALLIIIFTLGIGYPWAITLIQRWKAENTYINGKQLAFTGTGIGLFGLWIKWWILCVITIGIYSLWVVPRLNQWLVEKTDFKENIINGNQRVQVVS